MVTMLFKYSSIAEESDARLSAKKFRISDLSSLPAEKL